MYCLLWKDGSEEGFKGNEDCLVPIVPYVSQFGAYLTVVVVVGAPCDGFATLASKGDPRDMSFVERRK